MKKFIKIILIVMFLNFIPVQVFAYDNVEINQEQMGKIEGLYEYISSMDYKNELLEELNISPKELVQALMKNGQGSIDSKKVIKIILVYVFKELAVVWKILGQIMIVAIICALISNLQNAFSNEKLYNVAYFTCFSVIIIIIARGFYIGVDLASSTIVRASDFMAALMPVLIMLLASMGNVAQAVLMDPVIMGFCSIGSKLYASVIIPIVCMSFVLEFVNNISDEHNIGNLTTLLRKFALWAQGLLLTIFVAFLTIKGFTAEGLDLVTTKTAKFAVDNFIPIVGKTLSDAFTTVAGYTYLLKSSISIVGVIVILCLLLIPIIKVMTMGIMYKVVAALLEPVSNKKITSVINSSGSSMMLLGGCVISVGIMFLIMISIVATTGKGLAFM